jgi:hypothetical protein
MLTPKMPLPKETRLENASVWQGVYEHAFVQYGRVQSYVWPLCASDGPCP